MAGATMFTILNATTAFHQFKLNEKSSKLCTVGTPFGRHSFLRLPYGISSAPEVFHGHFSNLFENIEGCSVYIDDILIWGRNEEEHDLRLQKVLEQAQRNNVKFKNAK